LRPSFRPLSNESLHDLQFLSATSFESAGIVKNISFMIGEHKFVVDIVLAMLAQLEGSGMTKAK